MTNNYSNVYCAKVKSEWQNFEVNGRQLIFEYHTSAAKRSKLKARSNINLIQYTMGLYFQIPSRFPFIYIVDLLHECYNLSPMLSFYTIHVRAPSSLLCKERHWYCICIQHVFNFNSVELNVAKVRRPVQAAELKLSLGNGILLCKYKSSQMLVQSYNCMYGGWPGRQRLI